MFARIANRNSSRYPARNSDRIRSIMAVLPRPVGKAWPAPATRHELLHGSAKPEDPAREWERAAGRPVHRDDSPPPASGHFRSPGESRAPPGGDSADGEPARA